MILLLLFSLFVFLFTNSLAQVDNENTGSIKDTVTTNDNLAAALATVHIKEPKKTLLTDRDGAFAFDNIRPGSYMIHISFVGHEPMKQPITVADSNTVVSIQ